MVKAQTLVTVHGKDPNHWDKSDEHGGHEYYGAAIADAADNGGITINFRYDEDYHPNKQPGDANMWATIDTTIPATPFNEHKPVPPTLKQEKPIIPQNAHKPHVPVPDKPQLIPHEKLIPFTETPPAPPVLKTIPTEPVKPEDLSIQQHNVVINYTPSPEKQWEENNVNTNNKIYMNVRHQQQILV